MRERGPRLSRLPEWDTVPPGAPVASREGRISGGFMTTRRFAVLFALAAMAAVVLAPGSPARAEPAFKRLLPYLVDLEGWRGEKPDGLSMDMGDNSMTTATRAYRRANDQLHLSIIVGAAAKGAMAPLAMGMNVETAEGHMITTTIAGFKAMKSYTAANKSGSVMIALADETLFSLSYEGVGEEEALALVPKFDLKGVQAAAKAP